MIIACPNCAARYDIDDDRFLPGGRSVRCSDCGTSWFVPAPQGVETLMPSARVDYDPDVTGHTHEREDSLFSPHIRHDQVPQRRAVDRGEPEPDLPPRPKWGPMAERRKADTGPDKELSESGQPFWKHPRRRKTDKIVDTDWEDVRARQPHQGQNSPAEEGRHRNAHHHDGHHENRATILSPLPADGGGENGGVGIVGGDLNTDYPDAPPEVFASVNVQPRELERALKRVRRKAEARDKNRLTPMRLIGWACLFAVAGGLVYGGYQYREDIVRWAPGTANAYATVGIDVNPYGLTLKNIDHRVALSTTGPILEIAGELHNQGDKSVTPPLLQAEALDVHGKLLASWTFSPDDPAVSGGGVVSFSTRAPAPDGVVEVALSFAPEKGRKRKE